MSVDNNDTYTPRWLKVTVRVPDVYLNVNDATVFEGRMQFIEAVLQIRRAFQERILDGHPDMEMLRRTEPYAIVVRNDPVFLAELRGQMEALDLEIESINTFYLENPPQIRIVGNI